MLLELEGAAVPLQGSTLRVTCLGHRGPVRSGGAWVTGQSLEYPFNRGCGCRPAMMTRLAGAAPAVASSRALPAVLTDGRTCGRSSIPLAHCPPIPLQWTVQPTQPSSQRLEQESGRGPGGGEEKTAHGIQSWTRLAQGKQTHSTPAPRGAQVGAPHPCLPWPLLLLPFRWLLPCFHLAVALLPSFL